MDTALALLSLVESSDAHDAQQKGLSYLIQMQSGDGSWKRSPFIKIVSPNGPFIYESKTITTSLCIKALTKTISYNPYLKFVVVEIEDLPYERKIIDLRVTTNDNWDWILSKNNELIQRNSFIRSVQDSSITSFSNRLPTLHIIELTKECNQTCAYCAVSAIHSNPLTSIAYNRFEILDKIVEFILVSSGNSFCVEYQGGEALLNTQALKYLTKCPQRNNLCNIQLCLK
ncbi:hypothetical protein ASJ81_19725 [Methanosarcina spelaei]|uniref:Radical SAM core domain-containing protein n=1 Tax=Methanosarcina spelaei TaxID=1036679 RepID=A0A2A2HTW5_9EURY|nr:hypothetical protein ASJ81_19725 [Methanosarcina spelaei]